MLWNAVEQHKEAAGSSSEEETPNSGKQQLRRQDRQQFHRPGMSRLAGEHISVTLAPGASQVREHSIPLHEW